ncbi:hypothetical protein KUTeg_009815 [Tegillarca granosa]|uniref:L-serine ammonia-lyase n=1 Tax=Tegillarca granosa TaxID=220873 RepID=A0ABQ9F504_TEGGR|nr:hypothetical protein KUTeg_009815 [Tegillarca granosa]
MNEISYKENKDQLYVVTPTIHSYPMSKHAGFNVYLKLENLQKPGSFKIRGSEAVYKKAIQNGYHKITCASAGNAGITSAYVANQLGVPITVVMPVTTPQDTLNKISEQSIKIT